jgi:phosphate transport system substrate-binding protein
MKGRAMLAAPDLLTGAIMSHPYLALDQDVHGIGYSVYYYGEFMAPRTGIKLCAVDGVVPTSVTIRSRRYPLITEVFVAARRDLPPDHPARRLRDWLLEPAGQAVVEESGYVPILEASKSPPR